MQLVFHFKKKIGVLKEIKEIFFLILTLEEYFLFHHLGSQYFGSLVQTCTLSISKKNYNNIQISLNYTRTPFSALERDRENAKKR